MTITDFIALPLAEKSQLTFLDLKYNELNQLSKEQWLALSHALSQCSELTFVHLFGNGLYQFSTEQWHDLGQALSQCLKLTSLSLRYNTLDTLCMERCLALGQALKSCLQLTSLDLTDNEFGGLRIASLQQWSGLLSQFTTVHLSASVVRVAFREHLDAWALIAPNAVFNVTDMYNQQLISEEASYLHSKTGRGLVLASASALYALYHLPPADTLCFFQSSVAKKLTVKSNLPLAIVRYITEFLPLNGLIAKSIDGLDELTKTTARELKTLDRMLNEFLTEVKAFINAHQPSTFFPTNSLYSDIKRLLPTVDVSQQSHSERRRKLCVEITAQLFKNHDQFDGCNEQQMTACANLTHQGLVLLNHLNQDEKNLFSQLTAIHDNKRQAFEIEPLSTDSISSANRFSGS